MNGFKLLERAPGVSVETIILATEGNLIVEGEIPEMRILRLIFSTVLFNPTLFCSKAHNMTFNRIGNC